MAGIKNGGIEVELDRWNWRGIKSLVTIDLRIPIQFEKPVIFRAIQMLIQLIHIQILRGLKKPVISRLQLVFNHSDIR